MKTVEYWRWRYRNFETGRICRTMFACSAEEAARLYPRAERIQGTMVLREVDDQHKSAEPLPHVIAERSRVHDL